MKARVQDSKAPRRKKNDIYSEDLYAVNLLNILSHIAQNGNKNGGTWQLETVKENIGYDNSLFTAIAIGKNGLRRIAHTRREGI